MTITLELGPSEDEDCLGMLGRNHNLAERPRDRGIERP